MTLETGADAPLLSLCIPTYKRSALLRISLDAVLSQIGPDEAAHLEVLVVDNASPDDTAAVVAEFQQTLPFIPIHYTRNPENMGPDGNFLKAIRLAQGRFVLLVSDDDILLPGAVAKLLDFIRQHPEFDGFSLNARTFLHDLAEERPAWFPLEADLVLQDKNAVFGLLQTSLGFMSVMAFRKSQIAERLENGSYDDKIGSNFLQAFLFLDALAPSRGFAVAAQPLLAQRGENSPLDNYFRVFVTGINAVLTYAAQADYSPAVVKQVKAKNLVDIRHFVSRVSLYGVKSELWPSRRDALRRLFQMYRFSPYLWLVVVPLMFFPPPLRPVALKLRRLLGRPESIWQR